MVERPSMGHDAATSHKCFAMRGRVLHRLQGSVFQPASWATTGLIHMIVRFFAHLKDVTGCDAAEVRVAMPVTGDELWELLLKQHPALANHRANVRMAQNWEYADATTRFADGDEVALIPPVSGG